MNQDNRSAGNRSTSADIDLARASLARARSYARNGNRQRRNAPSPTRSWRVSVDHDEELRSGPGPDARDPQTLGAAMDALVNIRGWQDEVAIGGVIGRWADIVGADVAAHVSVEAFEPGPDGAELVLRADSTAWATQVRLLLPALRRRLDEELGDGVITKVRISGPAAPSWKKGAFHVPGRGPRDTYG